MRVSYVLAMASVKRFRQHVNPLSEGASRPVVLAPDWYKKAFADPTLPLTVDIGCAHGGWVTTTSAAEQTRNFLGLEIRKIPAVNTPNAHFLHCNANVDLERLLKDATEHARVERVLVQFPDPHFKKRHHKRRVVNDDLVAVIAAYLDGYVYVASDVVETAEAMRDVLRTSNRLREDDDVDDDGWLVRSPLVFTTERERCVLHKQGSTSTMPGRVFRCRFLARTR